MSKNSKKPDSIVKIAQSQLMINSTPAPHQPEVSTRWKQRGFGCDLWVDPPGQCWEDFTHTTDELVMVVEGKVEFEIAGKVHHPAPGEELLIPAGAVHSVRNIATATARWLYGYRR